MERDNLIVRLQGEAEEQYRIFNQKFVLTNRNPMLGVKVPRMRAIAREIAAGRWQEFLRGYGFCCGGREPSGHVTNCCSVWGGVSHAQNGPEMCTEVFFEEVMIIGMVIGLVNVGPEERLQLVAQFVPLIDNWAVCDVFCGGAKWVGEPGKGPKARNKVPREMVWEFLQGYMLGDTGRNLSGKKEFEIRFGVVMLMSYFLVPKYLERVFKVLGKVQYGDYYVDMGVAWCLATARAKFDLQTQEFVARAGLPAGVVKKYEQKVRDSLRVKRNPLPDRQTLQTR